MTVLLWCIDELSWHRGRIHLHGWAFDDNPRILRIYWAAPGKLIAIKRAGLPSPDVAAVHGSAAASCRFELDAECHSELDAANTALIIKLSDGSTHRLTDLVSGALSNQPDDALAQRFIALMRSATTGLALEIGSRARSGNSLRSWVPETWEYFGFDVLAGENVTVVGDAHRLSRYFPARHFDAVFSVATFEHLAMPWLVAVEINKVLKQNGIAFLSSHQSWPVHDLPWDFFRFSSEAWRSLFNEATGFEIIGTAMGQPAYLRPTLLHPGIVNMGERESFLCSAVLVRKVAETKLVWDVDPKIIYSGNYPV